ncbi:hypothetical protein C8R48DRAFT_769477 [Suillus tomentosus]|nr:hypothetical protein C8R48DRAFT_769477 [Suillus tomentosus]
MTLAQKAAQGSGPTARTPALAESPLTSVEGSMVTEAESPAVLRPIHSYSDVVRARSPVSDRTVAHESVLKPKPIISMAGRDNNNNELTESGGKRVQSDVAERPELTSSDEDDDDHPWIEVSRRGRERAKTPEWLSNEPLKTPATCEINISSQSMTAEREMNLGEGTSKGKGVDPQNWGDMMLNEEELDLEGQRAALESFKMAKEIASQTASSSEEDLYPPKKGLGPARQYRDIFEQAAREQQAVDLAVKTTEDRLRREYDLKLKENGNPVEKLVRKVINPEMSRRERRRTPNAMEPVRQVVLKAYIGQALGRLAKGRDADDDDNESDSLSSSSSSSSSGTSSSSESSHDDARRRRKRSSTKQSKSKKRKGTTLKPIAPTAYDGAVDSCAFHRFITEGTAYVKDGWVKSKKRVFVLSHYLKGKAHEFYIREVSEDPYCWRLRGFFTEMFNYCFPINFRTKQCKKLKRCFQNNKPVRDYIYELNELWNMIGDRELWKKELHPEISSFKEVQAVAEIIEIAHSIPAGRDKRSGPKEKSTAVVTANATTPARAPKGKGDNSPFKWSRDQCYNSDEKRAPRPSAPSNTDKGNPQKGLSQDEWERRKAEGHCFLCGELGHVSRQCPRNTHLKSNSPDKPTGIPSFGVHITQDNEECMRRLAEVTELSESLFMGSVGIFMEDPSEGLQSESDGDIDESVSIPSWRFRDPIACRVEDLLGPGGRQWKRLVSRGGLG